MYADPLDQASELEQQQLKIAMANRPRPKPFTGKCYYCSEAIDKGHYCDSYCRTCENSLEKIGLWHDCIT